MRYIILFLLIFPMVATAQPWINEIHYDNTGGDTGEGVEVAAAAGTDLSCFQILLYNGSNGALYNTVSLSGTVPDEGCGYGAINFLISGIQNGTPDGIALYNNCTATLIHFLSYEGSFSATSGPISGTASTNIGVSETSGTPIGSSLQLTGSGSQYSDFTWSGPSAASTGSLNTGQSITPCGGGNTITVGSVTGGPFSVTCTTTDAGSVAFTSSGTFNAGNVFTVQLSDGAGSFASPTAIGTLSGASAEGASPSGSISFTIPAGTSTSASYEIRIVSSNPGGISGNTATISVILTGSCVPPHITGVMINSCEGSCSEGNNELVFMNTGDYSINATDGNVDVFYGSSPSPTNNYTETFTTNPATTAAINADAACGSSVYVDGTGTTIPPNSVVIITDDDMCIDALTWDGLCSVGTVYMLYTTDATWSAGGNWSNSTAAGTRYFQSQFTTTSGTTFTIDYEYDRTQNSGTDGDYVTFSSAGGAPGAYEDNDCALTVTILPVEMTAFTGESKNGRNHLSWTTATELNSDYFTVARSSNGYDFEKIGTVQAAGYSQHEISYDFIDGNPTPGLNYYQLTGTDFDGTVKNHGVISLNTDFNNAYFDHANGQIVFQSKTSSEIYSTDGRLVAKCEGCNSVPFAETGIFFVVNLESGQTQKMIIH